MQNTSHAVMAQRTEGKTSLDDFPTPPWATRALVEHAISSKTPLRAMTCLEPACGRGHMSVTLAEYFREVTSYDVFDYSFGPVADFLKAKHNNGSYDWVITNPPLQLAANPRHPGLLASFPRASDELRPVDRASCTGLRLQLGSELFLSCF